MMSTANDEEFVIESILQIKIVFGMIPNSESPFENYTFSDLDAFDRDVTQYLNNIENILKTSWENIKSNDELIKYQEQKETIVSIIKKFKFKYEISTQHKQIKEITQKIIILFFMIEISIFILIRKYITAQSECTNIYNTYKDGWVYKDGWAYKDGWEY